MSLPNFIIAGVPKGGTTSLSYYLRQHPDVFLSPIKEPRYFLLDPENGAADTQLTVKVPVRTMDEYLALFADVAGQKAVDEATPFYMASPIARQRIKATIPDAWLIFSLREPIARAYSAYWFNVGRQNEDRQIEQALSESSSFVLGGRYFDQLSEWYKEFDSQQIKVVIFDDLQADSLQVCQEIFRFLGVAEDFVPGLTIRNRGGMVKNPRLSSLYRSSQLSRLRKAFHLSIPVSLRKAFETIKSKNMEKPPPIPDEVAQRLSDYYRDDIERLESLIGRHLSKWKRSQALS